MISHTTAALAIRGHLLTLSVATTGSVSIQATAQGYVVPSDAHALGFAVGMELTPAGFTDNDADVITGISADGLTITTKNTHAAQGAAGGRSLSVLLPSRRAWENLHFENETDVPYVEEEYIPGPVEKVSVGSLGELEALPQYIARFYLPQNTGKLAAYSYADAMLSHFAPGTSLTVPSGSQLFVRSRPAPFAGQLRPLENGFAFMPVNIPLVYRSPNSI